MTFTNTGEQDAIIAAVESGGNGVISAGAGTGKTSTLKLISKALSPARGLYIAYGRAIKDEATKTFPTNVKCMTSHGLAYGAMIRTAEGAALLKKTRQKLPAFKAAEVLNVPKDGFWFGEGEERVHMKRSAVAFKAQETVGRYAYSADRELNEFHVPREFEGEAQAEFATFIMPFARKVWVDAHNPKGTLAFPDDYYRKMWALTNPRLNYAFILYDEAQDAQPVMAAIVKAQTAQVIMVGDSAQAIYGFTGAVDALSKFDADWRLPLTQSFRFGPAVAEVANKFLDLLDADIRVEGFDKILSTVESVDNPDAILCRTNAGVIEAALTEQQRGRSVHIEGGTKEIETFARAAEKLISGRNTEHPDLITFNSWPEVQAHAASDEGRDLKVLVSLIDNYGVETILAVCNSSVSKQDADVICSTAHKSKGLEFNAVRIWNDFRTPEVDEMLSRAELMLAYVAVTRAKLTLDLGGLSWVL